VQVNALVDSASWLMCIPNELREELKLEEVERRAATLADGRTVVVPYVGPLLVRFENRQAFVGALVMGDEVLLGAVAMEGMNVSINPRAKQLIANDGPMPGIVGGARPA
jgi:clan AA aspartic protease